MTQINDDRIERHASFMDESDKVEVFFQAIVHASDQLDNNICVSGPYRTTRADAEKDLTRLKLKVASISL